MEESKNIYNKILKETIARKDKKTLRDEHYLFKYLFKQIDKTNSGFVSGKEIFTFIRNEKDAITFFDLSMNTFESDANKIDTQRPGLFNYNEFSNFLRVQKDLSA